MERRLATAEALLDSFLWQVGMSLLAGHRHPPDHQSGDLQPEVPDRRVGVLLARVVHSLAVDVRDVRRREVSRDPQFPLWIRLPFHIDL